MAGKAFELAQGYISLSISTQGMGKEIVRGLSTADEHAKRAGDKAGKVFARSFGKQADDGTAHAIRVDKLTRKVEAASKKVSAAREKEESAAAAVRIAEMRLEEIRGKSRKTASQVAAAQEKVRVAMVKQSKAADDLKDNIKQATRDHKELAREMRDPVKGTVELEVDNASRAAASFSLARLARPRQVRLVPIVSTKAAASAVATLSGLTSIQKSLNSLRQSITGVFQSIPQMTAIASSVGGLSIMAGAGAVNVLSLGASLASIAPAALALPGILGGVAIGAAVIGVAFTDAERRLKSVTGEFKALQGVITRNFWKNAQEPILNLAREVLPVLRNGLRRTSEEMGRLFGAMAGSLQGKLVPNMQPMFEATAQSIRVLQGATDAWAQTLAILGKHGSALLPRLSQWIVNVSKQFNNFLVQADRSGQLKQWIETGIAALRDLGRVAGNAGRILGGLGKAAADAGGTTLKSLADTLGSIADTVNSPAFQKSMTGAFKGLLQGAAQIRNIAGPALSNMFITLGNTAGKILPQIGSAFGNLVKGLATALASPGMQQGIQALTTGLSQGLRQALPYFTQIGDGVGALLSVLGTATKGVLPIFAQILGVIGKVLHDNKGPLEAIVTAVLGLARNLMNALVPVIEYLSPVIGKILTLIAGLVRSLTPVVVSLVPVFLNIAKVVLPILLDVLGAVVKAVQDNMPQIKMLVSEFGGAIKRIAHLVKAVWDVIGPYVMDYIGVVISSVISVLRGALKIIGGVLDVLVGIFTGDFGKIKTGVVKIFKGLWKIVYTVASSAGKLIQKWLGGWITRQVNRFMGFMSRVIATFKSLWTWIKSKFRSWWNTVTDILMKPVNAARKAIGGAIDRVQRIFQVAWNWVRLKFKKWWRGAKDILLNPIEAARRAIGDAIDRVQRIFQVAWNWVRLKFRRWWRGFKDILSNPIQSAREAINNTIDRVQRIFQVAWVWVRTKFRNWWRGLKEIFTNPVQAAKDVFQNLLGRGGTIRTLFSNAVDAVGSIWDNLKAKVKAPIKFVIQTVLNKGLIGGFNKLAGWVGADKIDPIKLPKGWHSGGYTGPGGKYQPAGIVHKDEFVIRKEARRRIEKDQPGLLDRLNKHGNVGYAGGGLVGGSGRFSDLATRFLLQAQQMSGMRWNIFQRGFRPTTSYSGTSHQGDAIDLGPTSQRIVAALRSVGWAAWDRTGKGNWVPHIHAVPLPGRGHAAGSAVWQAQDYLNGGDGLGGRDQGPRGGVISKLLSGAKLLGNNLVPGLRMGVNTLSQEALDALSAPLSFIKGGMNKLIKGASVLSDSPFGQVVKKMPGKLMSVIGDKLVAKVSEMAGGVAGVWSGAPVGKLGGDQLNNAATIIKTAKSLGFGDRGAIIGLITALVESQLKNVNYGDRDSLGLFQQRAAWGPASARTNPAQSAAMFFNGGRGGQQGLRQVANWRSKPMGAVAQDVQVSAFPSRYAARIGEARNILDAYKKRNKGYATGVHSAAPGWRWVGERGPELVKFHGGETVLSNRDSASASDRGDQIVINGSVGYDPALIARELDRRKRNRMIAAMGA